MPAFNRSSGSWRSVQTVYSRSETAWSRIAAGWVHDGTDWVQFFQSGIQDAFDRSNGSLGRTSDDKQSWSLTRGSWSVTSNQARASSSPDTYPMATVDVGSNLATIEADTPVPGSGIAFGVVDADNWYGAFVSRRTNSYDCNPVQCNGRCISSACNSCTVCEPQPCQPTCNTCFNCTAYKKLESYRNDDYICTSLGVVALYRKGALRSCQICSCTDGPLPPCSSQSQVNVISAVRVCLGTSGCLETPSCGCISGSFVTDCDICGDGACVEQPCVNTSYTNNCTKCGSICTNFVYDTCYSTCTDSYYSVRLVKSSNGVLTELGMTEGSANGFAPRSIRVETSGTGISVTAYENPGHTGTTLTVGSAEVPTGTRQGILVGPSPASQGTDVDNFYAEETE